MFEISHKIHCLTVLVFKDLIYEAVTPVVTRDFIVKVIYADFINYISILKNKKFRYFGLEVKALKSLAYFDYSKPSISLAIVSAFNILIGFDQMTIYVRMTIVHIDQINKLLFRVKQDAKQFKINLPNV